MVRNVTTLTAAFFFLLVVPARGKENVWEGYLFQDQNGDVRIGWPVIAMGVGMRPPHVLGDELAGRLKPYVSQVNDDYFFWNYAWFASAGDPKGDPGTDPAKVPLVLVKLRGNIEESDLRAEKVGHTGYQSRMQRKRLVMTQGKVETIEFLSQEWLLKWRDIRHLGPGPYWVHDQNIDATQAASIATKAIPLLKEMQGQSKISEEIRGKVTKVDPDARPVKKFQLEQEALVHRWLVEMNEKQGLNLEGLEELGRLPPSSKEIRQWFLEAADKKSFLNAVQQNWKGDLASLELHYYHSYQPESGGRATVLKRSGLDEILNRWSDKEFLNRQAHTKKMLEKRPLRRTSSAKSTGAAPRPY